MAASIADFCCDLLAVVHFRVFGAGSLEYNCILRFPASSCEAPVACRKHPLSDGCWRFCVEEMTIYNSNSLFLFGINPEES